MADKHEGGLRGHVSNCKEFDDPDGGNCHDLLIEALGSMKRESKGPLVGIMNECTMEQLDIDIDQIPDHRKEQIAPGVWAIGDLT